MNEVTQAAPLHTPPLSGKLTHFWDPLYDPADNAEYPPSDWDFQHTTGIKHRICNANDLKRITNERLVFAIKKVSFERCNFRGKFDFVQLAFSECNFELCDFGYAKWQKVKFTKCKFKKCSLTMLTFYQCQFIDCTWEDIAISGNETLIFKSAISNPQEFIQSAYTCLNEDVLRQNNTNSNYQKMRLEQTKAKVARIVLTNLERYGDDESYYSAIKTYMNQSISARIEEAEYELLLKKNSVKNNLLISSLKIERIILNASGKINAWGYSIGRPIVIGALLITIFGTTYYLLDISKSLAAGMMAGFDVTLLFGYTKQVSNAMSGWQQGLCGLNAFLGLWWYSVLVPTIINRISRVRA